MADVIGLRVWDTSGNLLLSEVDSITRVGGSFYTNGADGSYTHALIGSVPSTRVWWAMRDVSGDTSIVTTKAPPVVSVSGSTIHWSYERATKPNCLITWGVF